MRTNLVLGVRTLWPPFGPQVGLLSLRCFYSRSTPFKLALTGHLAPTLPENKH